MKKICDHPAGILFAVIVAFLIVVLNYYTAGNMTTALVLAIAIISIYVAFCLLCRRKENNEDHLNNHTISNDKGGHNEKHDRPDHG